MLFDPKDYFFCDYLNETIPGELMEHENGDNLRCFANMAVRCPAPKSLDPFLGKAGATLTLDLRHAGKDLVQKQIWRGVSVAFNPLGRT